MPVYKKNNKWFARVNYVDSFGNYKTSQSKYFDTKREAQESEIGLRQKLKETEKYSITFEEAFYEFIAQQGERIKPQSVNKLKDLFAHLKPLYNIKVEKLTMQQYKAFKEEIRKKDLSVSRKNKIHNLVCRIIDYCNTIYGIYNDVPKRAGGFHERAHLKEMDFFTLEEFNRFIEVEDDLEYRTFFTLLFFNGLRKSEALALNWTDYDGREINISKNLVSKIKGVLPYTDTPKTQKSIRRIPVNRTVKALLDKLLAYYREFPEFSDQWFIFGGIRPLSETALANRKNSNCRKAGVKQIRIHDFRHSCASYYINQKKAPIMLISKLLGHSKVSTTLDIYGHLYPNELSELMNEE